MLNDLFKAFGPMIAAAIAEKAERGEFRFKTGNIQWDGMPDAKRLEDIDLTGPAPHKVALMGSAKLRLRDGDGFAVAVTGDGADDLRFILDDNRLSIFRRQGDVPVVIDVTMPPPRALNVAGSGTVETHSLASDAKIAIAGSGGVSVESLHNETLKAQIMGSGRLQAKGSAGHVKVAIAGSGIADLAWLEANSAKISINGSGIASLASDGPIKVQMAGSGKVTVFGNATVDLRAMGSGSLVSKPRDERGDEEGGDATLPKPPKPPKKPKKPKKPKAPKPPKPPKSGGAETTPEDADTSSSTD